MIQRRDLWRALTDVMKNPFLVGYKGAEAVSLHHMGSDLDGYDQIANTTPSLVQKTDSLYYQILHRHLQTYTRKKVLDVLKS